MECFMCYSADGKLQIFKSDMDNETAERITSVLPNFLIPEFTDPIFICSTCLEQISLFYTIKKASLLNSCRLKYFNAMLKGTNNFKSNELRVIINSNNVSAQRKHHIQFNVNPKSKYSLSLDEQDVKHIKKEDKEYDDYSQQLVNDESNSDYVQDDESSSGSDDSTIKHKNSHVNKFTKNDFNLTSNNSRHEDQPKTQRENQEKIFKCTDCHKTFTKRCNLKTHSRVHTGVKPYMCTTCQKTFTQLTNLNTHKLTHTGEKPHDCDVCHKTFIQKSTLISHKRIHTNVRPYKCAVCSKTFTTSSDLTKHMRIHTGEKPHQCHLCEYKCTRADYLKIHIRSHTGEKPYSCKHCDKSFMSTSALKKHERRLHSNEDSR